MLNQKYFFFIILFFLLNLFQTNQQSNINFAIPESAFTPLNSREITYFELTQSNSELYYSFLNTYEGSDIIINLKIAKGFTSNCYIYDSYEKIKTDEDGEYIDYINAFNLVENEFILKNSETPIKNTKYYLIIKDILNSYNKDYISIFNEQDKILLEKEKPITFDKYYSKNFFNLKFSHIKNEVVTLELNIDNSEFIQYISIYVEGDDSPIYMGEINRGEIKLNEDFENEGDYIVKIESIQDPYTDIKSSIILHKDEKIVKELQYNNPLTLSYTGNKVFNFYVDIDDYDYNEENVITFKFGNEVYNRNLLNHCFAKAGNFETNDDNKFVANMPANEDENEAYLERLIGTTDVYQLYFKKSIKKEENKKTYLLIHLCLKIEEHDPNEYINPDEFTVFLSKKAEKINLEEYKNKNIILNKNIQLENYIPQIYQIVLPKNVEDSIKLSYVFYTSENIQLIYNNSMLNPDNHLYEESKMIYALSPHVEGYDYSNVIYIKLYGFYENEINFRIESTESLIYYVHNKNRIIKTLSNKLTDCTKSIYYIGDYGFLSEKGYFYQETLYGKINRYYKGIIDSNDKTILINEDSKYLIDNNLFPLDTLLDIVQLKCEIPGFYQVHLIDTVDEREINLYSKIYNYLPAGKNFTIVPKLEQTEEEIGFEISTPMGKEIKISDGEKIITINSNNKYYQQKYENSSYIPSSFTVLSETDAIISITLTNKEPFAFIEDKSTIVDYDKQILVKLGQNKNYESINIIVTRIYHGFRYSIYRGNVDYPAKIVEDENDYNIMDRSHKINMTIINPYLREDNINDENNVYYIVYLIDDPEMIEKEVIINYNEIKEYEKIKIGSLKTILNENEKYSLGCGQDLKSLNFVYQSCANSLKEASIYYYYDKIQTIASNETKLIYQHSKLNNYYESNLDYLIDINFKNTSKENLPFLNGAVIGITNKEVTDEDIKKYADMKLNISQNGKKVEWTKIDNIKQYDAFVLNENNTYRPYLKNPCLLQSIKNNETNIEIINNINNNDSYVKYYSCNNNSLTINETGRYIVVVSANVEGNIPLIYIYDEIIFDSNLVPPDDGGDDDDDDKMSKGTKIFLSIALPLVIIIVIVLLIVLLKSKRKDLKVEEANQYLVRETGQSVD